MNIHQKMVIFFEETMKAYSKAVIFRGGGEGGRVVLEILTIFIVL